MDPYENIVELYDLEHDTFENDVSFYANLVQEGPVLEVGCGTGRIVERLARGGLEVHGIDTSQAMLAAARTRLEGVPNAFVHCMAAEAIALPRIFRSVIWPLNVLWHLHDLRTQVGALEQVRACMLNGGLLVIDLSNPLTVSDREAGDTVQLRFQSTDHLPLVQGFSSTVDTPSEQLLRLSLWYDRIGADGTVTRTMTMMPLRYTYRFELELMVTAAGFRLDQVYGSYDLDPYATDSPNMLMVAVAA